MALDEGLLRANEGTVAVLAWAVASAPDTDASLAEIAPAAGEPSPCDESVLAECAAYDERLANRAADRRAPAFEACVRLATRAVLGPFSWERVRAIAAQLERAEIGVRLLGDAPASIFPRRVDDEIALERPAHDGARPRRARCARGKGSAADGGDDRSHGPGGRRRRAARDVPRGSRRGSSSTRGRSSRRSSPPSRPTRTMLAMRTPALHPTEWTASTAAALANALERGATTFPRVRAAAVRGGEAALDAIGAEMLDVGVHAAASAAFAEILSGSGRPRDVLRLVTYFAIAPDPVPAARALGACSAAELPRVLGAWLDAMLPQDGEDARVERGAGDGVHRFAQAVPAALPRGASPAHAPRRATRSADSGAAGRPLL